ncbi:hypothetical protein M426DRAFT_10566 [Hypoxylon sp. CI-4A]|nr:hypothetical protein M426DRAFT_10566 [Hypoxylon sp. CI-4A]
MAFPSQIPTSFQDQPHSIYEPLSRTPFQVRFIKILPGPEDQPIHCELRTSELSLDARYAALSYVWGNINATEDIVVNNQILPVTNNLASALRHFRKYGFPRNEQTGVIHWLWADAICINQSDDVEKGYQVSMMSTIYSKASAVLSWLGLPEPSSTVNPLRMVCEVSDILGAADMVGIKKLADMEIDKLRDLNYEGDIVEGLWSSLPIALLVETVFEKMVRKLVPLPPNAGSHAGGNEVWGSARALKENTYWTRVWVFQEMALAKSRDIHWLICGDVSVTGTEVEMLGNILGHISTESCPSFLHDWSEPEIRTWYYIRNIAFGHRFPYVVTEHMSMHFCMRNLTEIVCLMATTARASDPRDMVYGVLGLAPCDHDIEPDYKKSVRDVYLEAVGRDEIRDINMPSLLSLSGRGLQVENEHHLPSWLPDFTKVCRNRTASFFDERRTIGLPISYSQPYIVRDILCIQGVLFDHVEQIRQLRFEPESNIVRNTWLLVAHCVDYIFNFGDITAALDWDDKSHYPLQRLVDVLDWRLKDERPRDYVQISDFKLPLVSYYVLWAMIRLIDKKYSDEQEKDMMDRYGLPVNFREKLRLVLDDHLAEDLRGSVEYAPPTEILEQAKAMMQMNVRRTLFKTRTGRLGIGPAGMRQGDLVSAMDGVTLPVLLRESSFLNEDEPWLEHVGCCYVLGLSDGETYEIIRRGGSALQVFEMH